MSTSTPRGRQMTEKTTKPELVVSSYPHPWTGTKMSSWKLVKDNTVLCTGGGALSAYSSPVHKRVSRLRESFRNLIEETSAGFKWALSDSFNGRVPSSRVFKTRRAALEALVETALAIEDIEIEGTKA